MLILIIAIVVLGVVVALVSKMFARGDGADAIVQPEGDCSACSGDNARCMHDCMLEAAVNGAEYYDDEELDAFAGRPSDAYTDDEADSFREVMTTMQPHEVAAWGRSLVVRGIEPPDQIKDEMIMLMEG